MLLLDDELIYRDGLRKKLEYHPQIANHIEIISINNPLEAITCPSPDLAIIDVDLGYQAMNGFDVVAKLRARGATGLICTHSNRVLASDHKTAIEHGADAFLPKPMSTVHLLKLLCQALERLGIATPTLSSTTPVALTVSAVETLTTANTANEETQLLSAFVDDVKTIRMAWEFNWPMGKLITFATPELFWAHAEANSNFLSSLACVITDINFGGFSSLDGRDFAKQLKEKNYGPVFVATNDDVTLSDFNVSVDGILSKEPPVRAALEKLLKKS